MRHSAPTRLCDCVSFVLWLNCGVLVYVYRPSPGVQYPDGLFFGTGGRILAVYGYVEALFVPSC